MLLWIIIELHRIEGIYLETQSYENRKEASEMVSTLFMSPLVKKVARGLIFHIEIVSRISESSDHYHFKVVPVSKVPDQIHNRLLRRIVN